MSKNMQIQTFNGFDPMQVETIRHTLAKDASLEQFNLFMSTAVAAGLNPMLNHIYCIVYGGKMSIQISVEGIMYLAKRVEGYAGIDVQLVYEGDKFKAKRVRDENGKYYWDVDHEIEDAQGKVVSCYVFAYRDGFPPVFEHMKVEEVQHHLTGNNAANWKKYFNDFFKKTVVKRAAKRQYGIEISEDDAPEVGQSAPDPYVRKDITEEVNAATGKPEEPKQPRTEVKSPPKTGPQEGPTSEQYWTQIGAKLEQLGCKTKSEKASYINENFKIQGSDPTPAEFERFIKELDMEIAERESGDDNLE